MDFGDQQIVEEYVLKENIDDVNGNWEAKGTIQIVDRCFAGFEVCSESHLNKTDGIETEVAVDSRHPDDRDDCIRMQCIDGARDDLLRLKDSFYTDLENQNHSQIEIDCSNVMQSYAEVNCKDKTLEEGDVEIAECEANVNLPREDDDNLKQETANDQEMIYDDDDDAQEASAIYMHLKTQEQAEVASFEDGGEGYDTHVIITQDDAVNVVGSGECADNTYDDENEECAESDFSYRAQMTNEDAGILRAFSEIGEEIEILQNQDDAPRQDEHTSDELKSEDPDVSSQDRTDDDEISREIDRQQNKQYLYVRTVQLNDIIANKNKCVNVPLHQINLCHDRQSRSKSKMNDNCRKITVLNGDVRTIGIKQSDNLNAILFVSGDSLKSGVLHIGRNGVTVKDVKR